MTTTQLKDMSIAQLRAEHARLNGLFLAPGGDFYEHIKADHAMSRIEDELDYRATQEG